MLCRISMSEWVSEWVSELGDRVVSQSAYKCIQPEGLQCCPRSPHCRPWMWLNDNPLWAALLFEVIDFHTAETSFLELAVEYILPAAELWILKPQNECYNMATEVVRRLNRWLEWAPSIERSPMLCLKSRCLNNVIVDVSNSNFQTSLLCGTFLFYCYDKVSTWQ